MRRKRIKMKTQKHIKEYFDGIKEISTNIDKNDIENLAKALTKVKKKKRPNFFFRCGR